MRKQSYLIYEIIRNDPFISNKMIFLDHRAFFGPNWLPNYATAQSRNTKVIWTSNGAKRLYIK